MDTDDESDAGAIHYVVGDVTKPQRTPDKDAIIVHCVGQYNMYTVGEPDDLDRCHYVTVILCSPLIQMTWAFAIM